MDNGNHDHEPDWQRVVEDALQPTMNAAVDEYGNAVEGYEYAPPGAQYNNHINIHPTDGMHFQLDYSQNVFLDGAGAGGGGFGHPAMSMAPMSMAPGSQSDNMSAFHSYARQQASANMFEEAVALQAQQASSGSEQSTQASPTVLSAVAPEPSAISERRTSHGKRQLCPNQILRSSSDQTTTLSTAENEAGPPQSGGGPTSKNHTIPSRPKPGRKPAVDEPPSKRKAQNRKSQRDFRARKAKTVQDLQEQLAQVAEERKVENNENQFKIAHLEEQNRALRHENAKLQQRMFQFSNQQPSFHFDHDPMRDGRADSAHRKDYGSDHDVTPELGCPNCTRDYCACSAAMTNDMAFQPDASTPLDDVSMTGILRGGPAESNDHKDFDELETDFTAKFARSSNDETKVMDCGFCEGNKEVCICRDTSLGPDAKDEPISSPNLAMTGPGSCADCQSNPKQRAWCQRVAQLRGEATPPSSRRNSSRGSSLDVMEPRTSTSIELNAAASSPIDGSRTVGCSDTFRLLSGRVSTEPNAMETRYLKPVTQSFAQQDDRIFTMEPGMYSAMELDASSILTTLQHARGPLQPRASDGGHACLVKEAEERRRVFSDDHAMLDAVSQYNI